MYGQLWVLSFMQLVPEFKSSFYARFLLQLMSMAVGLGWYQSSWVIQKPRFWEVAALYSTAWSCSATYLDSPALRQWDLLVTCQSLLRHPLLSYLQGVW